MEDNSRWQEMDIMELADEEQEGPGVGLACSMLRGWLPEESHILLVWLASCCRLGTGSFHVSLLTLGRGDFIVEDHICTVSMPKSALNE